MGNSLLGDRLSDWLDANESINVTVTTAVLSGVKALQTCKQTGITTVGFSGNRGGQMAELCDVNVIVPSTVTMNIQEAHLALEHIFCMVTERCYFGPTFGAALPTPA